MTIDDLALRMEILIDWASHIAILFGVVARALCFIAACALLRTLLTVSNRTGFFNVLLLGVLLSGSSEAGDAVDFGDGLFTAAPRAIASSDDWTVFAWVDVVEYGHPVWVQGDDADGNYSHSIVIDHFMAQGHLRFRTTVDATNEELFVETPYSPARSLFVLTKSSGVVFGYADGVLLGTWDGFNPASTHKRIQLLECGPTLAWGFDDRGWSEAEIVTAADGFLPTGIAAVFHAGFDLGQTNLVDNSDWPLATAYGVEAAELDLLPYAQYESGSLQVFDDPDAVPNPADGGQIGVNDDGECVTCAAQITMNYAWDGGAYGPATITGLNGPGCASLYYMGQGVTGQFPQSLDGDNSSLSYWLYFGSDAVTRDNCEACGAQFCNECWDIGDLDGDGIPNGEDGDDDGDGIPDGDDVSPGCGSPNPPSPCSVQGDADGDGIINGSDPDGDMDGDGIPDNQDVSPFGDDCVVSYPDVCSAAGDLDGDGIRNDGEGGDADGDGIDDDIDVSPYGDGCPVPVPCHSAGDSDGDGIRNDRDPDGDMDGDGIPDDDDLQPLGHCNDCLYWMEQLLQTHIVMTEDGCFVRDEPIVRLDGEPIEPEEVDTDGLVPLVGSDFDWDAVFEGAGDCDWDGDGCKNSADLAPCDPDRGCGCVVNLGSKLQRIEDAIYLWVYGQTDSYVRVLEPEDGNGLPNSRDDGILFLTPDEDPENLTHGFSFDLSVFGRDQPLTWSYRVLPSASDWQFAPALVPYIVQIRDMWGWFRGLLVVYMGYRFLMRVFNDLMFVSTGL